MSDRTAVLALVKSLSDVDWRVRRDAADALAKIGVPPDPNQRLEVVSPLIRALEDDNQALVRANAADALGGIGQPAKQSVPALINAVNDEDTWVRINVVMALGLIKEPTDTVVTCLASTLDNADQRVRSFSLGWAVSAKQLKRRFPL